MAGGLAGAGGFAERLVAVLGLGARRNFPPAGGRVNRAWRVLECAVLMILFGSMKPPEAGAFFSSSSSSSPFWPAAPRAEPGAAAGSWFWLKYPRNKGLSMGRFPLIMAMPCSKVVQDAAKTEV